MFSRRKLIFVSIVLVLGVLIGASNINNLWTIGPDGFSIVSRRLPYWDFTNLWTGGRMALDGQVSLLPDVDLYRASLRTLFSANLPNQEWSYPPSMLLLGAPLATLPIFHAYVIWTAVTVLFFWLAIRPLGFTPIAQAALILSPAIFMNGLFGQNGALTCALLIGGLVAAPSRPVIAGLLFGLLTLKPHLGLLVPFCLIASRNWRAFAAAAISSLVLFVATGLIFGFDAWISFWTQTRPLMTAILEAPFPQPYHSNAMTVFFMARIVGMDISIAYLLQAITMVAAITAAIWLWMPCRKVDHRERVVATALLAIVATPYGYTYDAIALAIVVVLLFQTMAKPPILILAIIWISPYFVHMFNNEGIPLGGGILLGMSIWMLWRIRTRETEGSGRAITLGGTTASADSVPD